MSASASHPPDADSPARAMHSPAAVSAVGLSMVFEGRRVLNGLDLRLATGELVAVSGANGAGKTTLLRCLAGWQRPTSGAVLWFDQPPRGRPELRRLVGVVAHQHLLIPELTPRENLLLAARLCDVPWPAQRVARLLAESGLGPRTDRPTSQLSNGLLQRLAVARAVVHEPPILLLDEPFSGLDAEGHAWLTSLLRQARERGAAICLTAHGRPAFLGPGDRSLWLWRGRLGERADAAHGAGDARFPGSKAA